MSKTSWFCTDALNKVLIKVLQAKTVSRQKSFGSFFGVPCVLQMAVKVS